MNIGILGSFFNPPHIGHVLVTKQCLDFAGFDEVWLLPGFRSSFNKQLIDVKHRLEMVKLNKLPRTQISTLEIDNKLDGNTINLVPILKEKYPKDQFTFIIGSDQLATFHKWGRWQELLNKLPFLVFPRAGYPANPLYPNMQLLKHPLLVITNISSSVIRDRIKKGLNIDYLVTPKVRAYIYQNRLYK